MGRRKNNNKMQNNSSRESFDNRGLGYMSSSSVSSAAPRTFVPPRLSASNSRGSFNETEQVDLSKELLSFEEMNAVRGQRQNIPVHNDYSMVSSYGSDLMYSQSSQSGRYHSYDIASQGSGYDSQSVMYAPVHHRNTGEIGSLLKPPPPVQRTSLFGAISQCVNPTIPVDTSVPMKRNTKLSTINALQSDNDALDHVFNAVESFSCRDDVSMGGRYRQYTPPKPRQAKPRSHDQQDILDNMCEGIERLTCGPGDTRRFAEDRDSIDRVFDSVESFACNDSDVSVAERPRGWAPAAVGTQIRDPPAYKAKGKFFLKDGYAYGKMEQQAHLLYQEQQRQQQQQQDALDKFGNGLERMVCASDLGSIENEEGFSHRAINDVDDSQIPEFSFTNSLVEAEQKYPYQDPTPQRRHERSPSYGNMKPSKGNPPSENDLLDFVFENVEKGMCSQDTSRRNDPARFRQAARKRRSYVGASFS